MGEIGTIFENAILHVAGDEGVKKFSKAGHDAGLNKLVHPDGSLDLPKLMNILLDVFPEEQASAIADNVLAMYVEMAGEEQRKARVAMEAGPAPAEEDEYEANLAKYLETETSDVKDLINEARRIRMAMGKTAVTKHAAPPKPSPEKPPAAALPEKPSISLVAPVLPLKEEPKAEIKEEPPAAAELTPEALEREIRSFVMARKAYSSVDIMDFIRYLKDKGYHFQENIVLEDVYTWLEERKSRERTALMGDILEFLQRTPWPAEDEVSAFIDRKKSDGVMCEGPEIKRMILVEMIRKY